MINEPIEATHKKGGFLYMSEKYYEWDAPTWYRWNKKERMWSELLHKPRNLIKIEGV